MKGIKLQFAGIAMILSGIAIGFGVTAGATTPILCGIVGCILSIGGCFISD